MDDFVNKKEPVGGGNEVDDFKLFPFFSISPDFSPQEPKIIYQKNKFYFCSSSQETAPQERRYPIFVALERGLNASAYKRAFNPQ